MRPRSSTGTVRRGVGVLVLAAALAVVLSVAGSSATGAASSSLTASQVKFRQQLTTYISQLQQVTTALRKTPQGRAVLAQLELDAPVTLARARAAVPRLTPRDIASLQRAHSAYPAWRTIPARLGKLVKRTQAGSQRSVMITPNDCATARAAGITQTDVEIAADAVLAADFVLEIVPTDLVSIAARVIAVAVWAIPKGVLRGFEHLHNIASECDDNDHQALVATNLDVMVSTRATQTSVNTLTTNLSALSTLVNTNLDVAVSTRASQASLDSFHTEFTNNATTVNNKLDGLQGSVDSANTKLDTTLTKLDTVLQELDQNAATDLRLKIEANLAQPFPQAVIAFMLPAPDGYLELARDIVADSIQKVLAAGLSVGPAQNFFAQAETRRQNGDYKRAYQFYGNAYRAAANG